MVYFSNFQIIARKKHGKKHFSSLYYIDVVFLVRFKIFDGRWQMAVF